MRRILTLLFLFFFLSFAFADRDSEMDKIVAAAKATDKQHRGNKKQDQIMSRENPHAYLFGQITRAQVITYHNDVLTTISVQPWALSDIYEVNLAFCGNAAEKINGKTGLVVITYRKQMDRTVCFNLIDVRQTLNE